jgi:sigma-E factor negative regulatory protein RseC
MLTEAARVVAVEENSLWVETVRHSVCGKCSANKACGHGLLNRLGDGRRSYLRVSTEKFPPGKFQVDDQVSIAIREDLLLRSSFLVYLLPLLSALALAVLGPVLMPQYGDGAAIVGAVLGLAAGFGLVRWHAYRHRDDDELNAQLLGLATPVSA